MNNIVHTKEIFYDSDLCIAYLITNNLKINHIEASGSDIVVNASKCDYKLRRIEKEEFYKGVNLIRKYDNEFLPKVSWGGKSLYQMAEEGLQCGKWCAYGYFDEEERLVSYIDYKIRRDGNVEIGVAVTESEQRGLGLITSMLWMVRLKYLQFDVHIGTYEENAGMIRAIVRTGFEPYYKVPGAQTNKVRERISRVAEGELTNSVYFFSKAFLPQTAYAVEVATYVEKTGNIG